MGGGGLRSRPSVTRVVRVHRPGPPEVLEIDEIEVGEPGPDEVRIQVEAIGLNRAEAEFRAGRYLREAPQLPARIGFEAAGIVEAIGSDVEGIEPGEAVGTLPALPMDRYGVYAERVILPASAVVKSPAGVSSVEAAAIWMQYLTAYGALIDVAKLRSSETVVITAASSSVGLAAIQIANVVGAVPVAATRTSA